MLIKRIHTNLALMSLGHKHTFDSKDHVITYNAEYNMFQIDGTLIPVSSIREVLTESIDKEVPASTKTLNTDCSVSEAVSLDPTTIVEPLTELSQVPKKNKSKVKN